jgi:hypothetical protein
MFGMRGLEEPGGAFNDAVIAVKSDRATARALEKSAAYVWTVGRNSLKPAKQKSIKSLTDAELTAYRIAQRRFKDGLTSEKPQRPTEASKPGEPPRMQRPQRLLKVFLLYAQDQQTGRFVIGSARLPRKGLAPRTLEKGGTATIGRKPISVAPRPYMVPAMNKEVDKMAKRWENSITK